MPVGEQIAILYCGVHGLMSAIPVNKVRECQDIFLETLRTSHKSVIENLSSGKLLDEDTKVIEDVMATIANQYN